MNPISRNPGSAPEHSNGVPAFSIRVETTVDSDQIVLSEASRPGSTVS